MVHRRKVDCNMSYGYSLHDAQLDRRRTRLGMIWNIWFTFSNFAQMGYSRCFLTELHSLFLALKTEYNGHKNHQTLIMVLTPFHYRPLPLCGMFIKSDELLNKRWLVNSLQYSYSLFWHLSSCRAPPSESLISNLHYFIQLSLFCIWTGIILSCIIHDSTQSRLRLTLAFRGLSTVFLDETTTGSI